LGAGGEHDVDAARPRITVAGSDIDTVTWGPGHDIVFADPADKVVGDCGDRLR
jgi:hypothetical protein